MSDEAALLAAILAHPDEDTPRLAYADWLDEHGDAPGRARAEFIRLGIELARTGLADRRRKAIETRCADLERAHRHLWLAPFRAASERWPVFGSFRRGFVSHLTGGTALPYAFAAVAAVCPVQELDVDLRTAGREPVDVSEMATCPALSAVRRIALQYLPTTFAEALFPSPHLTGLQSVRAHWCPGEVVEVLSRAPAARSLRELWVRDSGIGGVVPGSGLGALISADWPSLESVRIDHFAVGNDGARALVAAFAERGLKGLHVSDHRLTLPGVRAAVEAALPGRPDSISLAYSVDFNLPPRVAPSGTRELRLENFFNDDDPLVGWLVGAVPPGRFDRLGLVGCRISQAGAGVLAGWPGLAHVKELDLSNNWIGDRGAVHLAESPHLERVETVFVAHNDITKTGKDALKKRFGRRGRIA